MSHIIETPSPNFDERSLPVTMLVLHYTGDAGTPPLRWPG
jgi:N-acetylmuramoyl-L-alanine amidase